MSQSFVVVLFFVACLFSLDCVCFFFDLRTAAAAVCAVSAASWHAHVRVALLYVRLLRALLDVHLIHLDLAYATTH